MGSKRQYLGSTDIRQDYWSGGKDSRELKLNETLLYAEINCCNSMISICDTYQEAQKEYNKQDLMYLCLVAVERSGSDYNKLSRYGNVIGNMIGEGKIYRAYSSLDEENSNLDLMIDEMELREPYAETCNDVEFLAWFEEKVLGYNCYRNYDGSITYDRPKIVSGLNGLGGGNDTFSEKMVEAGTYMLYLVNDNRDVYEGCVDEMEMSHKMINQRNYMNWFGHANTNMTYDSILVNARSGIIEKTKRSPKEALNELKGDGVSGLGDPIAILSLVLTAISVLTALAKLIVESVQQSRLLDYANELQNNEPSGDDMLAAAPDGADYGGKIIAELKDELDKLENKSEIYEKISSPAFVAGIVAVFVAIFGAAIYSSRKKKKS
jgi:hypothetical protein